MILINKIEHSEEEIIKTVHSILKKVGIKMHISGFRMWTTAVLYAAELANTGEEECTMGNMYRYVAKKHKSTAYRTERKMRYALLEADKENIKKFFDVNYNIDNSAFLSLMLEATANRLNFLVNRETRDFVE